MKKHSILKKLTALAAAAALALSLCACAKSGGDHDTLPSPSGTDGAEDGKTYKVAIIKQMDHASLDEIANAVAAELEQLAADNGVKIEYEITSGQGGDQTILKQLADQAVADKVDEIGRAHV